MDNNEKNVIVVSIDKYSFDILLKKKFYGFPNGSRQIKEYFAFYRNGEITHYSKVKDVKDVSITELGVNYWLYCFPDSEPPFKKVIFDKLIKLKTPIKKDGSGRGKAIQGRVYTTFNNLMSAKLITDLF